MSASNSPESMMKRYKLKNVFFLLVFFYTSWSYSGICYEKRLWLSNDDYIRAVVNSALLNNRLNEYYSIDDFLKKNPNCCNVDVIAGNNAPNIIFALFGHYRVLVNIRYPVFEEGLNKIYHAEYFVSKCGRVGFNMGIAM